MSGGALRLENLLELRVDVEHAGSPYTWSQQPGIECWYVTLVLSGKSPRHPDAREATVAWARLWRVDNRLCIDQSCDLDDISFDLGVMGGAIVSSIEALEDWDIAPGMNTSYLIADLGLVDKHWRGRRAGPALLFFAAEILRVDAIFLKPGALVTHLNKAGRVSTDYAVPRPGPDAQKKVRKAWRRAGFTKLTDGVVWRVPPQDCGIAARAVLEEIQHEANTAKGRAWWLRRVNRAAAATSAAP